MFVVSSPSLEIKMWKLWINFNIFLVIWTRCYNTSVTGQHQVIGSQDVLAKLGDDVIVPCHIEPSFSAVRMTVEWLRPDLVPQYVHVLQDGRDNFRLNNPLYNQRTYLFHENFPHGNISLKLSRVQLSDEGKYKCNVVTLQSSSLIQLFVGSVSQPVISSNGPKDSGLSLTCDSGCWYPQPEMSWLDGDENLPAGPSVTHRPSQRCYIVESNVTVKRAGQVTCRVHLPRFNHTAESHHVIPESVIHKVEGGTTAGVIAGIVTMIIIILGAAVLGYVCWKKRHPERDTNSCRYRGDEEVLLGNPAAISQGQHKSKLRKKFQYLLEWITEAHSTDLDLDQIYPELYITVGGSGDEEHETPLQDIFKTLPGQCGPIRTVMTMGVAGIGKTALTQKYILDWANNTNQDIHFVFPFTFRALNLMLKEEKKYSLVELIHYLFGKTNEAAIWTTGSSVFIFDGLDECDFPLKNETWTDVTKPTSVDVLLTNLIEGNLLPSAHIWITTRPAAANQIPSKYVHRVTEVRGFTDPQKEKFFMKRFSDKNQARTFTSHIQTSQSLHSMCHIPVFCWTIAAVLEDRLGTETGMLLKSLTEMYLQFMLVQSIHKKDKYHIRCDTCLAQKCSDWNRKNTKAIMSLGKLAFEQLEKGNLINEADLTECGINIRDARDAAVYSGVFTQMLKDEPEEKVFCFVHLSVQEFLAALHVFVSFINDGVNLLSEPQTTSMPPERDINHLYQSAVDKALQSPNGHLDLFLRFLLGLSLETNQSPLQRLLDLGQTESMSQTNQKTVEYIKEKIKKNLSPKRIINLLHCLNELNDNSFVEKIKQYLSSGSLSTHKLSPAELSDLNFILLSEAGEMLSVKATLHRTDIGPTRRREALESKPK